MTIPPDLSQTINSLPLSPGVYIYKNKKGQVIYVGKSTKLRDRVKSYFDNFHHLAPKTRQLVKNITEIDHIVTDSELEALILEAALIKKYQPRYNIQGKDDKNYFYIKIANGKVYKDKGLSYVTNQEIWPAVKLTHQTKDKKALYFGPFISGKEVRQALKILRKIFGWCEFSSQASWRRHGQKACFYRQIKLCPGVCDSTIDLKTYWQNIKNLILFLEGKKKQVKSKLEKKMHNLAKKEKFEEAAKIRDFLKKLDQLVTQYHTPEDYLKNPNLVEDVLNEQLVDLINLVSRFYPIVDVASSKLKAQNSLLRRRRSHPELVSGSQIDNVEILNTSRPSALNFQNDNALPTFTIEAYDISHLGTEHGVGSRVVFTNGRPNKKLYRQYKLKTQVPNDYQALKEVLTRRFKKTKDLPDLIVIDGGKGQVRKIQQVADVLGINTPIVGLAKKPDRLVIYDKRDQDYKLIPLSNRPAGLLLARLRDEAHRFANRYRKKLMKKSVPQT